MSMRLKRLLVGVVAALPTALLIPGEASAACINAVNASVGGAASQTNTTCATAVTLPGVPAP